MKPLSPRVAQIVSLSAEGLSSKEIAERLGIGVETVESHWKRLRERFDTGSRTAIVASALGQERDLLLIEIAERRRAEKALQEANDLLEHKIRERTRMIVDKMNELVREAQTRNTRLAVLERAMDAVEKSGLTVVVAELGGVFSKKFLTQNMSQFGLTAEELVSGAHSLAEIMHPEDMIELQIWIEERILKEPTELRYLFRMARAEGGQEWVYERDFIGPATDGTDLPEYRGVTFPLEDTLDAFVPDPAALRAFLQSWMDRLPDQSSADDPQNP